MPKERIDKILSSQTDMSRSDVKALVRRGSVTVDGRTVKRPEEKFDPDISEITVNGETLIFSRFVYIMMNKPKGVLSASRDPSAPTVIDLLPPDMRRPGLFPAGRLDKDTEGFVLITDDGELAHRMLSPKSHVYKLYEAVCDRELTEEDARTFASGITEGGQSFLPAEMKLLGGNRALVEICEGKFHQIKRMFLAVGAEVTELKRLRIGDLLLDTSLAPGECRHLTQDEVRALESRASGIDRNIL